MKLSVVDIIHPQSNKFATGVENKATGDSKRNESLGHCLKLVKNKIKRKVFVLV